MSVKSQVVETVASILLKNNGAIIKLAAYAVSQNTLLQLLANHPKNLGCTPPAQKQILFAQAEEILKALDDLGVLDELS
jgi:hypothetical protein